MISRDACRRCSMPRNVGVRWFEECLRGICQGIPVVLSTPTGRRCCNGRQWVPAWMARRLVEGGRAMVPLYNRDVRRVGWLDAESGHIFGTNMDWLAYVSDDHAWSASTGAWLGPMNVFNCLDRDGRVVAWTPAAPVESAAPTLPRGQPKKPPRPLTPPTPEPPLMPARPPVPQRGWSTRSWTTWLTSGTTQPCA